MTLFELIGKITIDNSTAKEALANMQAEAQEAGSKIAESFDQISEKCTTVSQNLSSVGKTLAPISAAAAGILTGAVKTASDFEDGMAKMSTLFDTTKVSVSELSDEFLNLSNETGKSATELAEAGYQALSASVDVSKVGEFTRTAANLAKAGFLDTATSVDVLTTAVNAYKMDADEARQIANNLVKTQNLGKTTVDELAQSMGQVIPVAASSKVSLDNLLSSYVQLTKQGINTHISTTYLRTMLVELADSGSTVAGILQEKTGKSFQELMAEGQSLGDVIGILNQYSEETGTNFNELWSSTTAMSGAMAIANYGADSFNETLNQMKDTSDTVGEALDKLETPSVKIKKAFNSLKNTGIELGTTILSSMTPAIEAFADGMSGLNEWFSSLPDGAKQMIAVGLAITAALAPVILIIAKVIGAIGTIAGAISGLAGAVGGVVTVIGGGLATAFTALLGPIGIVVAVIAGLAAVFILLYNNCEDFRNKINDIWTNIKDTFKNAIDAIQQKIEQFKAWFSEFWSEHGEKISGLFQTLLDALLLTVETFFTNISNYILLFSQLFTGDFEGAFETVKTLFNDNFGWLLNVLVNFYTSATSTISNGLNSITSGITSKISNCTNWIHNKIQSLYNGISSIAQKIKGLFNFNLTLPKIKLPHFNISPSGWKAGDLLKGSIPSLSVKWYKDAMDTGVILNKATAFGIGSDGSILGAGESAKGSETVVGTNSLMNMISSAVQAQSATLTASIIDAIGGMNIHVDNTFAVDGTALYKKSSEYTQNQISRKYKNSLSVKGA